MAIPGGWTPPRTAGHGPGDPGADEMGRRAATAGSSGGNYNLNTAMNPRPDFTDHSAGAPGAWASMSRLFNKMYTDPPSIIGLARGGIVRGPGGPRDDKVPLEIAGVPVKLSNQEAVLPARTVDALGGPEAVERLIERTNGRPPERRGLRAGGRYEDGGTFIPRFDTTEEWLKHDEQLQQDALNKQVRLGNARGPDGNIGNRQAFTIDDQIKKERAWDEGNHGLGMDVLRASVPYYGQLQAAARVKDQLDQGNTGRAAIEGLGLVPVGGGLIRMLGRAAIGKTAAKTAANVAGDAASKVDDVAKNIPGAPPSPSKTGPSISGKGIEPIPKPPNPASGAAAETTAEVGAKAIPKVTEEATKKGLGRRALENTAKSATRVVPAATREDPPRRPTLNDGQPKPPPSAPTPTPEQTRNQAIEQMNQGAGNTLENLGIDREMGEAALTNPGQRQDFSTFKDATNYGRSPDSTRQLRTGLPDGWGVVTRAPGQGGLRNATLYAPETYTGRDGLPTRDWRDTQRYSDAIAQNERNKGLLREYRKDRYLRDLESPRPLIQQAAQKGLDSAYRDEALATGANLKQQELGIKALEAQAKAMGAQALQGQAGAEKTNKLLEEAVRRATTREDKDGKPRENPREAQEMLNFFANSHNPPPTNATPQEIAQWVARNMPAWDYYRNQQRVASPDGMLDQAVNFFTGNRAVDNGRILRPTVRKAGLGDALRVGLWDAFRGREVVDLGGATVELDDLVTDERGNFKPEYYSLLYWAAAQPDNGQPLDLREFLAQNGRAR
jgi:hypothetical protein